MSTLNGALARRASTEFTGFRLRLYVGRRTVAGEASDTSTVTSCGGSGDSGGETLN